MFCARCGEQIPESSETCPLCGHEANVKLPAASGQALAAPALNSGSAASAPPIRKELRGVGGWLLLFCISFTILWPLWMLGQYSRYHFSLSLVLNPVEALRLLCIVLGVVVGVTLWMQSSVAISLLRVYFILAGLLTVLNIFGIVLGIWAQHFPRRYLAQVGPMLFWSAVKGVGPSILSLAFGIGYFSLSKRVQATYGCRLFTSRLGHTLHE